MWCRREYVVPAGGGVHDTGDKRGTRARLWTGAFGVRVFLVSLLDVLDGRRRHEVFGRPATVPRSRPRSPVPPRRLRGRCKYRPGWWPDAVD